MPISMPIVWSDAHRLHEPGGEIWVGVRTEGTELPERADRIRAALEADGAPIMPAEAHPDGAILRVHDKALVAYLESAWDEWQAAGLDIDPGQDRVVPYIYPHPGIVGEVTPAVPAAASARAGAFCFDTMTLIGPGTWEAARGAANAALTAVDLVIAGERVAYALCRPPGHHVTRTAFGGSCYLNNSAIAAAEMRERIEGPVAIVDVDAHHGNGAQSIFWADDGVLTGSVHVDPGAGWFPHFLGFANERGTGAGESWNMNVPLSPGAGDEDWLAAVAELAHAATSHGARALVVALGVDAAGGDPESPLDVSMEGYREAGKILGALGLPTVIVQEGGYDLGAIGGLVTATLKGFEDAT